jgi:glutamyl-tRNA synthetase
MIKTRFAPSPTGYLHIGGARTALFCWLYARAQRGEFMLRIEDTDRARSTQAAVDAIFDAMAWLQLDYDEKPVYQTQRMDRYQAVIQTLLDTGHAYRCYCSKERLETLRETQMQQKEKPRYDGLCRDLNTPPSGAHVIRFKNPQEGAVSFHDFVRGEITVNNKELDDFIIARTDGTPTYNFSVVVDDMDMGMTHVLRGADHINNTPRQINVFSALGATPPQYGHVPMILGRDGKKLSKRHNAVSVMHYRDEGFFPQALLNYLVRLGWSHGDQEIFSKEEMISLFDLEHISRSPAVFDEEKLLWVNAHYMKTLPAEHIAKSLVWHMAQQGIDCSEGSALLEVVEALRERATTLKAMAAMSRYFYEDFSSYDERAAKKHLKLAAIAPLKKLHEGFSALTTWEKTALHAVIINTGEALALKLGKVGQPLRIVVTGGPVSPPMDITLALIGRKRVLERIEKGIAFIEENVT